ncbi:MAG: pyridoxal phosphate-dependent aminotransferase [Flavobacteriales bacterium]
MPNISQKGRIMPASPIRKLVPFADKAKSQGKTVFHLNIGQPDIKTPAVAREKIKNLKMDVVAYSDSAGILSYRKALVDYYSSVGINIHAENVMVTTGGSEALTFSMMSCMDAGDEVIIPEPFYANYNGFGVSAGVNVVPVTSSIDDGFALPPISAFEEKITDKTKAILICNPGNPTGYMYSKEELEQLRVLVLKHDLFLIADEVYREFVYDGLEHYSVMSLDGLENNAVMIDSVSKRYSMCGARIGAVVTRNKELYGTILKFAQARLSPPTYGQVAGEAALSTPQSYFDGVKEEYVNRRNTLVNGLNEIPGVKCPLPKGAFYCIAELPVKNTEHFCQWMLEEFSHNNQTIMMAPASGFYSTKDLGLNQVRIAYVLNEADLTLALECLKVGLREYAAVPA